MSLHHRQLASHLSYKSALVLLCPTAIAPPIESIRSVNDKNFARWPPHINLIYPFLANPSEITLSDDVHPHATHSIRRLLKADINLRIRKVLSQHSPFDVTLEADAKNVFSHSKKSKTVWLAPQCDYNSLKDLQSALQMEFSECSADSRPFTPHLSVGQSNSDHDALQLHEDLAKQIIEFTADQNLGKDDIGTPSLHWHIDAVFVIERHGFHGRFNVVSTVPLGNRNE